MDRLGAGCERLGLVMPPQAVLLREVQTASAGLSQAVVKIVLTQFDQNASYFQFTSKNQIKFKRI